MYKMILTEGGSIGDIYVNTLRTDEHGAIYVHPSDQVVVTQPDEFVKAGNSAPKYNLGWGNTFSYKGLPVYGTCRWRSGIADTGNNGCIRLFKGYSRCP